MGASRVCFPDQSEPVTLASYDLIGYRYST